MGKLDKFLFIKAQLITKDKVQIFIYSKLTAVKFFLNSIQIFKADTNLYLSKTLQNVDEKSTSSAGESEFHLYYSYVKRSFQCKLGNIPKEKHNYIFKSIPIEVLQSHGLDRMLNTIFKNVTMKALCERVERKGIYYIEMEVRILNNFSPPSIIYTSNYRFVKCGRSDITALRFYELIPSFQLYLWIWTIVTISCNVPFALNYNYLLTKSNRKFKPLESVISCYKLLLEQGNPFSQETFNVKSLRWLLSAVIFITNSNGFL